MLANRIDGCFVFHFRNGSIIPYFAIDVIQIGKTTDYSFDLTTALVNSGFSVPDGFLLSNRDNTRKLLVEFNSVAFLGKDKPYFVDHLHIAIKYQRKMKRRQNVFYSATIKYMSIFLKHSSHYDHITKVPYIKGNLSKKALEPNHHLFPCTLRNTLSVDIFPQIVGYMQLYPTNGTCGFAVKL